MKTKIKLCGYISFDIVNDQRLQHSSIRLYFHLIHLYLKNGDGYVYTSLYNTLLEDLQISNNTLTNALKQLKKCEYISIKEDGMREVIVNGRRFFPGENRTGSPPRDLRASFEPEKAVSSSLRENQTQVDKKNGK